MLECLKDIENTFLEPVKIYCEATLVFPLIVAQTFAKYHQKRLEKSKTTDE